MPKAILTCRVCGKQYKACRTPNPDGVFRYKEVTCSPECGQEYLRRVLEERDVVPVIAQAAEPKTGEVAPAEDIIEDIDCGFDEYEEDAEEFDGLDEDLPEFDGEE